MSTIMKKSNAIATLKSFEGKQNKAIEAAISVAYYYLVDGQVNMLNILGEFCNILGMKQATGKLLAEVKCHAYDVKASAYTGKMTEQGKKKRDALLEQLKDKSPEECFMVLWALAYPAKVEKAPVAADAGKLMRAQLAGVKKLHEDPLKWDVLPASVKLAYEALQRELARYAGE